MELLERDRYLHDLNSALQRVKAGNGRTVLISGEAGIGKTTLVREFVNEHREVGSILWGGCEALFTPRPLGPLHDIARQTPGHLSELLNDEANRTTIFSAFLDELQRCTPLAITVFEDVHWADEATLDVIKFLGRRIHLIPALLIITYRDDEIGAQHPLRFVLGDLPGTSVTRLHLPPLSEAAVATLAQRAHCSEKGLYAATGGNPFFVTEVLASSKTHDQGIPVTVRDTVLARAARLSSAARYLLDLASVVPARVERWLVDTIFPAEVPTDSAVIDECVESGMLRLDNTDLTFRHELARLAIEDSLSPVRRQDLHALVLKALINRASPGAEQIALSRLVHHARHSGDREAVLRYAPLAAKQASSLGAHRESVSHYASALHYGDHFAPEERAGLLEDYSYECYLTDGVEEAILARQKALSIWRELSEQEKIGHNLRWLSRLSWFMGNKADADAYAIQSVRVLEQLPPGCELAMTYSNCAQLYMLTDETAKAVDWGQRAIALAEQLGDNEILAHALNNIGAALMPVDPGTGKAHLEKSLQISLDNAFEEHAARAYTNLASRCVKSRFYPDAIGYLNDGIHYCIERDLDSWNMYMTAWRARYHLERGNWQAATDDAHTVLGKHRVSTIAKIPAVTALARVRVRRGDPEAMTLLDEALTLAMPTRELQRIEPVLTARAEAAWLKCDLKRCVAEAQPGFEMALTAQNLPELGELSFWMWRGGAISEPPTGIEAPFELHISGDWQAAADAWEKIGCPYEQAIALADGDEMAQRKALEIFVQLGAAPAAEIVRQKLRALGVRGVPRGPRPATKQNPAGLTARQLEVLALMAEGLQNAEIAIRLSTSTKTVDHHVSAVLAKLEARSRGEAVTLANQLGMLPAKDGEVRESK